MRACLRLAVLLLVLVGLAAPVDAAIVRVNTSANENYTGASSSALTSTAASLTGGNSLIVIATWGVDSATVSSVTDTAGNTFSAVAAHNDGASFVVIWAATNVTGNGSNTVTVNLSGTVRYWAVMTLQYSGLVTSSVANMTDLTATGQATSSTTVTSSTWGPTAQANEVLIAATRNGAGSGLTPDTGYSIAVQDTIGAGAVEDRIVSSVQGGGSTVSMTGSTLDWVLVFASFKEAGGGGGGTPTKRLLLLGVG